MLAFQKIVAQNIRYFRKKKFLTQSEMAERSEVNYRHLQKIEAGTPDIRVGTVWKMAETLDVPSCYMLKWPADFHDLRSIGIHCCRELLDVLPMGLFVLDTSHLVRYVNPYMAKRFGVEQKSFVGIPLSNILANAGQVEQMQQAITLVQSTSLLQRTMEFGLVFGQSPELQGRLVSLSTIYDDKSGALSGYLAVVVLQN